MLPSPRVVIFPNEKGTLIDDESEESKSVHMCAQSTVLGRSKPNLVVNTGEEVDHPAQKLGLGNLPSCIRIFDVPSVNPDISLSRQEHDARAWARF